MEAKYSLLLGDKESREQSLFHTADMGGSICNSFSVLQKCIFFASSMIMTGLINSAF